MTGNSQSRDKFITSYRRPWPSAPSPKKHTATCFVPSVFGKRRARRDAHASAYNCVRSKVAAFRVGDVHRAALAAAIARFLAEQFGEHAVWRRAFGQTMPVAAVRARDVIVAVERLANPDRDGFFADV